MGVCARGVTKPYFIDSPDRVNGKNYSEEVLPYFRTQIFECKEDTDNPSTTNLFRGEYLFQQDLPPPHWANTSTKFLDRNIQSYMPKDETPQKI